MKTQQMSGEVVEINCEQLDGALPALREERRFDEDAVNGSTLHELAKDARHTLPGALRPGFDATSIPGVRSSEHDSLSCCSRRDVPDGRALLAGVCGRHRTPIGRASPPLWSRGHAGLRAGDDEPQLHADPV